ncbi:MAG: tetratricopeptide repeat protein [Chthoniobacterales bacterium]|nr:tetratricopeptide repeat protein [Chthoniobacterales bacterium]
MRTGFGALIFFLVLSSFAASNVAPTKAELEAMYAAAAQDLNAGNYREALKKLDAIDLRQPDLAAAQNLRGVALMRLTEYRNAESALRKARAIDPGFWEAHYNLAEVPFLTKNWTLARSRLSELIAEPNEHVDGATRDLIQFKILLTCLLEEKVKQAGAALEKLQSSPESPALYYAKAALALQHRDQKEAKQWIATAAKEYSPQLNRLFTESFYEVGWLPKPKDATPVALEVSSPAERVARAQAELARAQRAFRQGDFAGAEKLLDRVEAIAPNQAVTYNLRGEILLEQGKIDEAEMALRNALAADPQLLSARYNLARVPFARKNFAAERKELEALQGACSGAGEERREQLIRYQIYLTLLLEGREGAAQKAMDEFKMMDGSPALYYAQAAWAFQHGNALQGKNWVANARNLFSAELNRSFAAPLSDLGWLGNKAKVASVPSPTSEPMVAKHETPASDATPAATAPPVATATPAEAVAQVSPSPAPTEKELARTETTPAPKPEESRSPTRVARAEKKREKEPSESTKSERKRSARKKSREAEESAATPKRTRVATEPAPSPPSVPSPTPVRENIADKVRNFFLYPFRHPLPTPTPVPARVVQPAVSSASPTPSPSRRRNN